MALGLNHPITEICLLVQDVDRSIEFYEKIGFKMQRRGDGFCFANFDAAGIMLAVWDSSYVARNVGLSDAGSENPISKSMAAFKVKSAEIVDSVYDELVAAGIPTLIPPKTYDAWNSYGLFFTDPDGNAWEVYCWGNGGPDHSWPEF